MNFNDYRIINSWTLIDEQVDTLIENGAVLLEIQYVSLHKIWCLAVSGDGDVTSFLKLMGIKVVSVEEAGYSIVSSLPLTRETWESHQHLV